MTSDPHQETRMPQLQISGISDDSLIGHRKVHFPVCSCPLSATVLGVMPPHQRTSESGSVLQSSHLNSAVAKGCVVLLVCCPCFIGFV